MPKQWRCVSFDTTYKGLKGYNYNLDTNITIAKAARPEDPLFRPALTSRVQAHTYSSSRSQMLDIRYKGFWGLTPFGYLDFWDLAVTSAVGLRLDVDGGPAVLRRDWTTNCDDDDDGDDDYHHHHHQQHRHLLCLCLYLYVYLYLYLCL